MGSFPISLEELALRAQNGDGEAYHQLYLKTEEYIRSYTYRRVSVEKTERCMQQTYVRIYNSLGSFAAGQQNFDEWFYGNVQYYTLDFARRNHETESVISDNAAYDDSWIWSVLPNVSPEQYLSQDDADKIALQILEGLASEQRKYLLLRLQEGLGDEQIAAEFGIATISVVTQLQNTLLKLQKQMEYLHRQGEDFLGMDPLVYAYWILQNTTPARETISGELWEKIFEACGFIPENNTSDALAIQPIEPVSKDEKLADVGKQVERKEKREKNKTSGIILGFSIGIVAIALIVAAIVLFPKLKIRNSDEANSEPEAMAEDKEENDELTTNQSDVLEEVDVQETEAENTQIDVESSEELAHEDSTEQPFDLHQEFIKYAESLPKSNFDQLELVPLEEERRYRWEDITDGSIYYFIDDLDADGQEELFVYSVTGQAGEYYCEITPYEYVENEGIVEKENFSELHLVEFDTGIEDFYKYKENYLVVNFKIGFWSSEIVYGGTVLQYDGEHFIDLSQDRLIYEVYREVGLVESANNVQSQYEANADFIDTSVLMTEAGLIPIGTISIEKTGDPNSSIPNAAKCSIIKK